MMYRLTYEQLFMMVTVQIKWFENNMAWRIPSMMVAVKINGSRINMAWVNSVHDGCSQNQWIEN